MYQQLTAPFIIGQPDGRGNVEVQAQPMGMAQPIPPEMMAVMMRREEELFQDEREIKRKLAMEAGKAEIKARYDENRKQAREQTRVNREKSYDRVEINEFGEVVSRIVRPEIEDQNRRITNMTSPRITRLKRLLTSNDEAVLLQFQIGQEEKSLFLDLKKMERKVYFQTVLVTAGVQFYLKSSKVQAFLLSLWSLLCQRCHAVAYVPEESGWNEFPNGKIEFVGEEDLTWDKVQRAI